MEASGGHENSCQFNLIDLDADVDISYNETNVREKEKGGYLLDLLCLDSNTNDKNDTSEILKPKLSYVCKEPKKDNASSINTNVDDFVNRDDITNTETGQSNMNDVMDMINDLQLEKLAEDNVLIDIVGAECVQSSKNTSLVNLRETRSDLINELQPNNAETKTELNDLAENIGNSCSLADIEYHEDKNIEKTDLMENIDSTSGNDDDKSTANNPKEINLKDCEQSESILSSTADINYELPSCSDDNVPETAAISQCYAENLTPKLDSNNPSGNSNLELSNVVNNVLEVADIESTHCMSDSTVTVDSKSVEGHPVDDMFGSTADIPPIESTSVHNADANTISESKHDDETLPDISPSNISSQVSNNSTGIPDIVKIPNPERDDLALRLLTTGTPTDNPESINLEKTSENNDLALRLLNSTTPTDNDDTESDVVTGNSPEEESDNEEDLGENPDFTNFEICQKILFGKTKYRFCILQLKLIRYNQIKIYATTLNTVGDRAEDIIIPCNIMECMGAEQGDEVIIETTKGIISLTGKVVFVFRRVANNSRHKLACECGDNETYVTALHNVDGERINITSCNQVKNHLTLYKLERRDRVVFDHYEPMSATADYLYEVTFLSTESYKTGSEALITRQISKSNVNENILKASQKMLSDFPEDVIDTVNDFIEEYQDIDPASYNAKDLRRVKTFSIYDKEDDGKPSMTFSVTPSTEQCDVISVHIPDVATFVTPDSTIDIEAKDRGVSVFVPGRGTLNMLPSLLVTTMWTPEVNTARLAWTVQITVDKNGCDVNHDIKHSVISVDTIYSYNEVKTMLNELATDLNGKLLTLQRFAKSLKNSRLIRSGKGNDSFDDARHPVELIMEEVSQNVNRYIGKILMETFPMKTPILCQAPPDITTEWKEKYLKNTLSCFIYDQKYTDVEDRESSVEYTSGSNSEEEELIALMDSDAESGIGGGKHGRGAVAIFRSQIEEMYKAMIAGRVSNDELRVMLRDPYIYPSLVVALNEKEDMMKPEMFICSDEDKRGHYSMNVQEGYCTFTQPVHSYMDLVVQRLIKARVNNEDSPYEGEDIFEICDQYNQLKENARTGLQNLYQQHLMEALKKKPLSLLMIIEKISPVELTLCAVNLPSSFYMSKYISQLKFNKMAICDIPSIDEDEKSATVSWQERIYDICADDELRSMNKNISDKKKLDTSRYVRHIHRSTAAKIVDSVTKDSGIKECVTTLYHEVTKPVGTAVRDVTSEVLSDCGEPKLCDFQATFAVGDSIKVQVAVNQENTDTQPMLQLLSLTPSLDVCIEHITKKASAFVSLPEERVDLNRYHDIDVYKKRWKAIVSYESAETAVRTGEGSIIHNVPINWEKNLDIFTGSFELDRAFYEEQGRIIPRKGYICVRYANIPIPNNTDWPKSVTDLYGTQSTITWTAHCSDVQMMIRAGETEKNHKAKFIKFRLHSSSTTFPEEVLLPGEEQLKLNATIEWLPIPTPHIHMLNALNDMHDKDCVIAKDIALGEVPGYVDRLEPPENIDLPGLAMNELQHEAIINAFKKPFALIHGPPGTGKTLTGGLLAYHFLRQNRKEVDVKKGSEEKSQVLYCTPSNKAADVLVDNLRKINDCHTGEPLNLEPLNFIRVYSHRVEQKDYPIPGRQKSVEKSTFDMDERNHDVALHHLIRVKGEQKFMDQLVQYDYIMRNKPEEVDEGFLRKYRETVTKASKALLNTADIVITTCTGSAAGRIVGGCKFRQVIIDEGGMSSEPESLIPIVNHRPKQVVIIGDHKQLEAIIQTDVAQDLGMKRSMFERYAEQAVMLVTQYRMHEMIGKFPSDQFYGGKLECGKPEQKQPSHLPFWPGGANIPLAFCHLVGEESSLVVATKDGSEHSKRNEREANAAVCIAELLVRHGIKTTQIAILTQYCAQQALIRDKIRSRFREDEGEIKVSTVIASQGNEWDYVIFSMVRSSSMENAEVTSRGWLRSRLGFITDEHQMNVSLTRAKNALILIGNSDLLHHHDVWGKLIDFYKRQNALVDCDSFIMSMHSSLPKTNS